MGYYWKKTKYDFRLGLLANHLDEYRDNYTSYATLYNIRERKAQKIIFIVGLLLASIGIPLWIVGGFTKNLLLQVIGSAILIMALILSGINDIMQHFRKYSLIQYSWIMVFRDMNLALEDDSPKSIYIMTRSYMKTIYSNKSYSSLLSNDLENRHMRNEVISLLYLDFDLIQAKSSKYNPFTKILIFIIMSSFFLVIVIPIVRLGLFGQFPKEREVIWMLIGMFLVIFLGFLESYFISRWKEMLLKQEGYSIDQDLLKFLDLYVDEHFPYVPISINGPLPRD